MFINQAHEQANQALKNGDVQHALTLFNDALRQSPGHPDIIGDRGVVYLHLNDRERCFRDLNEALEIEPERPYRYSALAYAKNHFGDIDGAIDDYQTAVKLDPDDAVAFNNLGLLLEQKGYHQEAKEKFERADRLSALEDELLKVVDQLEGKETIEITEQPASTEPKRTAGAEFKKLLTSRKQFREFILFIKNGFRIK